MLLLLDPDGAPWAPRPRADNGEAASAGVPIVKMLNTRAHATLEDLGRAKSVNATYVSRIARLTLLAPDSVEAILDGRQPAELQPDDLLEGPPVK